MKNVSLVLKDKVLLKNINLEVLEGEILFIVGLSGSGKTSILNILFDNIDEGYYEGHIFINNKNMSNISMENRDIGIVDSGIQKILQNKVKDVFFDKNSILLYSARAIPTNVENVTKMEEKILLTGCKINKKKLYSYLWTCIHGSNRKIIWKNKT